MINTEQQLRDALPKLADDMPLRDLTGAVITAGKRARRRRMATAVASSIAAVVLIVAGAVVVPAFNETIAPPPVDGDGMPAIVGANDPAFRVAAPMLSPMHGPAPLPRPDCTSAQVNATAATAETSYGVVGVVTVHAANCSLIQLRAPAALLGRDGHRLDVPAVDLDRLNPPDNGRPDLMLNSGDAQWGFAWQGSWCGELAAAVRLPLRKTSADGLTEPAVGSVDVPLSGPQPRCTGSSDSALVPGVVGAEGLPTLPPPPSWSRLTPTLLNPQRVVSGHARGLAVRLSNDSAHDIQFSPCAAYQLQVFTKQRAASTYFGDPGTLGCDSHLVVPAGGSTTLPLGDVAYDVDYDPTFGPLTHVTLSFALAGLPTTSVDLNLS
jgi:hypothetical protein